MEFFFKHESSKFPPSLSQNGEMSSNNRRYSLGNSSPRKSRQSKFEMAVIPVVADEAFPVIADPIDNSDSQILNGEEEVFVGHQGAPDGTIGVYQICSPIQFYSIGFFNHGS